MIQTPFYCLFWELMGKLCIKVIASSLFLAGMVPPHLLYYLHSLPMDGNKPLLIVCSLRLIDILDLSDLF